MLVGRGSERAAIDALLEETRNGRGSTLVLRGEPGIGKTALLEYASEQASELRVLRALGVQSEAELAFSGLHELLRPELGRIGALPSHQAEALSVALALAEGESVDRFAVYAAALSLLGEIAGEQAVLCLVDDAQWLDIASAEALRFVCRRLADEPILVLLAAREGDEQRFEASELPELRLEGLHRDAAQALLAQAGEELSPDLAERVLELSRGNPLALLEMPTALSRSDSVEGLGLLPVGSRVERAFLGRVRALSDPATQALLVAAAAGSTDLAPIAGALEADGVPLDVLEEAEAAGLIVLGAGSLAFAHPLVRSAVYGGAEPASRRRVHAALARALGPSDTERHAWHLAAAATGPDEAVALALERAGELARKRGGPIPESFALERAARLTQDPEAKAQRLRRAASAASGVGHLDRIRALCEEALTLTKDPELQGDIHFELENTLYWAGDLHGAHRIKMEMSVEFEPIAPAKAANLRARATASLTQMLRGLEAVEVGESAMEMLRRNGGRDLRVPVMYAQALVRLGRVEDGRRVLASASWDAGAAAADVLWWNVSEIEVLLDNHERAAALIAPHERAARAAGDGSQLSSALEGLASVDVSAGRLVAAHAAAVESVELADELEQELLQQAFSAARLAMTAAAIGSSDTLVLGERALELAARCDSSLLEAQVGAALGALELSLGRPERAIEHLERVRAMVRGGGYRHPAFLQYAPELIEAYVHEGRLEDAHAELGELDAAASAAGTPWALAAAVRCRGILSDDFEIEFEQALTHHERSPRRVEQARTHLAYGSRLRRAGRRTKARKQLRGALGLFEAAGAPAWAERARAELTASGETIRKDPAAREELTPQEFQVAMAVSRGATNKEVAAQLFLSTKTIEFHLRNAFRKVGVRSRTELANALRESSPPGTELFV